MTAHKPVCPFSIDEKQIRIRRGAPKSLCYRSNGFIILGGHKYCLTYHTQKDCLSQTQNISCSTAIYKYFYLKLKLFGTLLNLFRMKPS